MDDTHRVRRAERIENPDRHLDRLPEVQRASTQALRQGFAVDQLHDEKPRIAAVDLGGPDIVECADMWMRQPRDGPSLALEAFAAAGLIGEIAGEHLDGDFTIEPCVSRAIDLAHAAGAEQPENLERAEPRPRRQGADARRKIVVAGRTCG